MSCGWAIVDVYQMQGKECKDQKKLKCKKQYLCQSEEGTLACDRPMAADEKRFVAAARNSVKEKGEQRGMRLFRTCVPSELGKVVFGLATQGIWLGNGKV